MEQTSYDIQLDQMFNGRGYPAAKEVLFVPQPVVGKNAEVITSNGNLLVKTDQNIPVDHLLDKLKDRAKAKKVTKEAVKATGAKPKDVRTAGRQAAQTVKSTQLVAKAKEKEAKGNTKAATRLAEKAIKVTALQGKPSAVVKVKAVAKAVSLYPLIPLMPVMGAALKKKGFTPPKNVADRAELFYNEVVRKESNKFEREQHFDGYNDHLIGEEIVVAIIDYIKTIQQKKNMQKAGQPVQLSPTDQVVSAGASKVLGGIERAALKAGISPNALKPTMPGSNSKDNTGKGEDLAIRSQMSFSPLIIGAVAIGAFLLLNK